MGERCEQCDRPHGFGEGMCHENLLCQALKRAYDESGHVRRAHRPWANVSDADRDRIRVASVAHAEAMADCRAHAVDWRAEALRLRAEIARWEALGERHNLKPRDPGCKCTWEEGDSACPVHPTADDYIGTKETT